ncbi:restriction endonuclease [Flavobacterium sp. JLP]|uniref:nSTAND3 domain-containing NTPase n=1 Tax=Flavobacterium sp. JLP TaxID=2783793 RepID=UPI00188ACFEE|nr:restriction endonuclease [Flavobacterium sp. JLP]MBF4505648.1 restriction endonuclease [Flavobacterium sp. JLP]
MKNYDFNILSPYEFELLTRDLLQLHLDIFLESFGEGADQGIDLRYSKGKLLIIQAKRYKNFNNLFTNLKKEVDKVKKLKPERYILATSVSLSPAHKVKIKKLFDTFIKYDEDIFGKEDFNNLLNKFPSVEKNHFKLWLSSIDILNEIFNNQIVNRTNFSKEEIIEKIKVYVQNDSFNEASDIINQNKYVIISGTPGIGKTTLAEMLVFSFLSKPGNEFVFLSDSIDDAFKLYNENKNQIFLFDDFLGRNFLQNSIALNDEKKIVQFINKIQKSNNKFLIFTTREYILNQAQQKFDVLNQDLSKCVLDITKYSKLVKAQILYNHLLYNDVPFEYVDEIIKQNLLFKIINHQNYNPRIIEAFTNHKFWKKSTTIEFPSELIKLFNSPFLIWEHVYENQITEISRTILNSLLISGRELSYDQLFKQTKIYETRNLLPNQINNYTYKASLKELENSMIQINNRHDGTLIIEYLNPSIQDFLVSYINKDSISKNYLINAIQYVKPSLDILTTESEINSNLKIKIHSEQLKLIKQIIIQNFDNLEFITNPPSYFTVTDNRIKKLHLVYLFFKQNGLGTDFIQQEFAKICYSEEITNRSVNEFSYLVCHFADEENFDVKKILSNIIDSIWDFEDLSSLSYLETTFTNEFELFRENNKDAIYDIYYNVVSGLRQTASESEEISNIQNILNDLNTIEYDFGFDTYNDREEVKEIIKKLEQKQDEYYDSYSDDVYLNYYRQKVKYNNRIFNTSEEVTKATKSLNKPLSENDKITDLFKSLKSNGENSNDK